MHLALSSDRLARRLFYPIAFVCAPRKKRGVFVNSVFDPHIMDPEKRYYCIMMTTYLISTGIPLTTWVMGQVASSTNDLGLALQVITAPMIFAITIAAAFAIRMIEASFELKTWRTLRKQTRLDEYEPGHHALQAIPRDGDILIPLIVTLIATPLALPFMGMAM